MQIAMISYWSCPGARLGIGTAGGMNVYVLNLAQALGELGHTVDIYAAAHPEEEMGEGRHPNVSVIHLARPAGDPYAGLDAFAAQMEQTARRRGARYEVVHAHYYYSGLVGLKICERMNLPLLATFHTLGSMKKQYMGIEDRRRIEAESMIVEQASAIIASTELESADLQSWHHVPESRIFTVHPGVDHHLFRPRDRREARQALGLSEDENLVLFVGRIDPIKGIHLLIDAIARITAADDPALRGTRLMVIGGDPENEEFWTTGEGRKLRVQIEAQRLEQQVVFVGSQPHSQLVRYYAAADVVAMPSAYETFGFVALEAMASGAAVVASRVGGLQYLIQDGENGRLFDPPDTEALAAIIAELLLDPEQKERLGRRAAQSSYRYCLSGQAEKMLEIYRGVAVHAA